MIDQASSGDDLAEQLRGRRIVVTGAAGTVGLEIVRRLLTMPVEEVRLLDNAESALFEVEQQIDDARARAFVVDVRDEGQLERFVGDTHDLLHCAAYKHVPACERNPRAAVENNIVAVQNLVSIARRVGIERVIFTSSDKAVNPTNVMGTSKLMGERLITAANALDLANGSTIFASTRFGNVLGSNGSVVPIFRKQIEAGRPITLTSRAMTRFVMTKAQSAQLVLRSLTLARGGEVFVTKMPALRIEDLAVAMNHRYGGESGGSELKEIGVRPGEKLWEELMTDEELPRTVEIPGFFAVLPAFRNIYGRLDYSFYEREGLSCSDPYRSDKQTMMTMDEIDALLTDLEEEAHLAESGLHTPQGG